jgi:hypothetical protein
MILARAIIRPPCANAHLGMNYRQTSEMVGCRVFVFCDCMGRCVEGDCGPLEFRFTPPIGMYFYGEAL